MRIRIYEDGDIEVDDDIMADECDLLPKGDHVTYNIPAGCGAHVCIVRTPRGQGVNGPCMCLSHVPRVYHIQIKKHLTEIGWEKVQ